MDFIAKSSSQGFYGEDQNRNRNQNQNQNQFMISTIRGKLPFSSSSSSTSSSSSPSSQPHKSLVPLPFHHHHHHHQRGSWLENKFEPQQPSAEEISSIRCYPGGTANLELMESSPVAGNNGDGDADAADDDNDVRRGDSSFDCLGLGIGGGGRGTASASTVGVVVVEREHMFDKVVTPSDVGKLNRLVIPKQHAEKYFPLDSSTNEKGLLLNFEDRNGKPWRFRYSYWNSSQSYVMTKGWSRFVKEKKLDAGDIVSFQRGVGELGKDHLFIDWRRRPDAPELPSPSLPSLSHLLLPQQQQYFPSSFHRSTTHPWSPHFLQPQAATPAMRDHSQHPNAANYHPHSSSYGYGYGYGYSGSGGPYSYNSVVNPCSSSVFYLRSAAAVAPLQAGMVQVQSGVGGGGVNGEVEPAMVFESVPVVHGKAAAKRLRLFGVNMDCPISESDECDILSSTTTNTIPPHATTMAPHLSSTPIPPLQLRLYNSSPLPAMHSDLLHKANASNKSFDFDI